MFLTVMRRLRVGMVLALALLCLPALAADTNTVSSIRTVKQKTGQTLVEVTLHSTRSFGARDEVVHMDMGKTMFLDSRSPKNGSEYTLIFTMTPAQFKALPDKTPIVVSYGHDADSGLTGDTWPFGPLNKSLLDKK